MLGAKLKECSRTRPGACSQDTHVQRKKWKVNSQCFNDQHTVVGDRGRRSRGKVEEELHGAGGQLGSSCVCEGKLGFRLALELGLGGWCICHFLYHPALETGRPGRESHDEHLDAAAGLSPDKRHREREECAHEAGTLPERTRRRRPRVRVRFPGNNLFLFILTCRIKPYFWNSALTYIAKTFQSNLRIPWSWVIPWFISVKLVIYNYCNTLLFCSLTGW